MQQYRKAVLYLLVCVVLWSTSGVLIKESTLPAMAIVGGRGAITAIVLALYIRRPQWTWSIAQIGGAVAYLITVSLFVTATQMTSAANAILLQYTAPLWVALFGVWYLHEKPSRVDYVTMLLIGAGMLLFFGDKLTADNMLGNVLAILSGVALAWMTLFLRKQKDGSPFETMLLGNLLAALHWVANSVWGCPCRHGDDGRLGNSALLGRVPTRDSVHTLRICHQALGGN